MLHERDTFPHYMIETRDSNPARAGIYLDTCAKKLCVLVAFQQSSEMSLAKDGEYQLSKDRFCFRPTAKRSAKGLESTF
jgi:hypothetical protein